VKAAESYRYRLFLSELEIRNLLAELVKSVLDFIVKPKICLRRYPNLWKPFFRN